MEQHLNLVQVYLDKVMLEEGMLLQLMEPHQVEAVVEPEVQFHLQVALVVLEV